ncbi:bifunctional diguanylate cyclase/phosphodiesterase [Methylovorus mays]|uniref:bifunctional diguanylate cyclase/phosphodiesterase n=1 Tax=Methylovorus mays TaxID=184077 RepID=UPI001E5B1013|nr:bifunctional diguanylate cyclase/phosphodiesterase [Methylovorus mays]MCB5208294.1 EAL domain-containing protein [Methylovorus mays]
MSRLDIHTDAGDTVDIPAILSFALNKVTESIFLIDPSSRIRYVNQECCRTLGYSEQELLAMRVADIDPGVDQAAWDQHWQELTGKISLTFESRHRTHQGKLLPVEINANYVEYAGTAYNLALVRDISTRKHLQDQLEASEAKFRDLVEHAPDIFIRYDRDCRRIFISQAYETVYGIPLENVLGKKPTEVWGKAWMAPEEYENQLQQIMRSRKPGNIELQWVTADGQYVCKSLQVAPEFDAQGDVVSVLSITRDISQRRAAENALRLRDEYQRALIDNFPFMVWLKDRQSHLLAANAAYAEWAQASSPRDVDGKTDFDLFPEEIAKAHIASDQVVLDSGKPWHAVDQVTDKHGRPRWMEIYKSPVRVNDELKGIVGYARDVTEAKLNELEIMRREIELRTLIDNTPDAITRFDLEARRIFVNNRKLEKLGVERSAVLGKTPSEFPGGPLFAEYEQKILDVISTRQPGFMEMSGSTPEGESWHSHIRIVPELDEQGRVQQILAVERDITELVAYRERVYYLAYYDSLTNLPNRTLFNDRISQVLMEAEWSKQKFGVMVLDLDHFKSINDSLGHLVGDELLCATADRLQMAIRTYDTVARMGGDEFAILLPDIRKPDDLATIASKIVQVIAQPFHIQGKELFISTSVGIATYPLDGEDQEALYKCADAAMYHAKSMGRSNYQFYSHDLGSKASEYIAIGTSLRHALRNNEFVLHFQPQIDLLTGKLLGAEALLRWNHPLRGMLQPADFIGVAEESGLIVEIGEWVLENAFKAIVELNQERHDKLTIAINLSARQFLYNDLLAAVTRLLEQTGCLPGWVKLEIRESLLLEENNEVMAVLNAFKAMGITIAIDDFCTGYSALSYLGQFPVRQVKIDRLFMQDVVQQQDRAELVNAIIRIAQALHLELVAEGVESASQLKFLREKGCTMAQGFFLGKPMLLEELEQLKPEMLSNA